MELLRILRYPIILVNTSTTDIIFKPFLCAIFILNK